MDTTFPRLFHASQLGLSAYSLYISAITVPKLRKNEDLVRKAAKWSNYVDRQLTQVQTTEASGALTVSSRLMASPKSILTARQPLFSVLSAVYLIFYSPANLSLSTCLFVSIINSIATGAAHMHVRNFWKGKAHITFAKDFSDSIDLTNLIRRLLAAQSAGWAAAGLWYAVRWISA